MKKLFLSLSVLIFSFVSLLAIAPTSVSALTAADCQKGSFLGLPAWYKYQEFEGDCSLKFDGQNPTKVVAGILLALFEILLRVGGMVAVGFVIFGGFQYITSQGEPERAKNARNTILNAVIGLIITLVAAPLVSFLAVRVIAP